MKKVKQIIIALAIIFGSLFSCVTISQNVSAVTYICGDGVTPSKFLGVRQWCSGVVEDPDFTDDPGGNKMLHYVAGIIENFIQMILDISSYASIVFVLIGAIFYITAGDSMQRMSSSKKYIGNALVGLVIMRSSALVIDIVADIADVINENTSLEQKVQYYANEVFFWGGVLTVIMIVLGAFYYASSKGEFMKMAKGKKIIIQAVSSLVLLMFSATITNLVLNNFNYTNTAYDEPGNAQQIAEERKKQATQEMKIRYTLAGEAWLQEEGNEDLFEAFEDYIESDRKKDCNVYSMGDMCYEVWFTDWMSYEATDDAKERYKKFVKEHDPDTNPKTMPRNNRYAWGEHKYNRKGVANEVKVGIVAEHWLLDNRDNGDGKAYHSFYNYKFVGQDKETGKGVYCPYENTNNVECSDDNEQSIKDCPYKKVSRCNSRTFILWLQYYATDEQLASYRAYEAENFDRLKESKDKQNAEKKEIAEQKEEEKKKIEANTDKSASTDWGNHRFDRGKLSQEVGTYKFQDYYKDWLNDPANADAKKDYESYSSGGWKKEKEWVFAMEDYYHDKVMDFKLFQAWLQYYASEDQYNNAKSYFESQPAKRTECQMLCD